MMNDEEICIHDAGAIMDSSMQAFELPVDHYLMYHKGGIAIWTDSHDDREQAGKQDHMKDSDGIN